jgi:hypothetical protein
MKPITMFALVGLLFRVASALDAPYLISATPGHDSLFAYVDLRWRNNSTAYTGIIVLRKDQGSVSFARVDTVEANPPY